MRRYMLRRARASAAGLPPSDGLLTEAGDATSAATAVVPTDAVPTAEEAASDVAVATAAMPVGCATQYVETDIRPIRVMWNSSYGYCGEASLQMTLLARGVWIGQAQSRSLAGCGNSDLILNSRSVTSCSVLPLLTNSLAFDIPSSSYWDDSSQQLTYASATSSRSWPYASNRVGYPNPAATGFMQWAKRHIIAGRPVILAVRLAKAVLNDAIYDHIVPAWGVCSTDMSANAALGSGDGFSLSTDFGDEVFRATSTTGFYSRWQECPNGLSWGKVGCIPSDTWNYGLAVGHLKDSAGWLVKTSKLVITGWSDNKTPANYEPGEGYNTAVGNSVTARYNLTVSGLVPGTNYTTYRYPGRLPPLNPSLSASKQYTAANPAVLPSTQALLKAACTAKTGCTFTRYNAPAGGQVTITEATLGAFVGNSLQYFFTVLA